MKEVRSAKKIAAALECWRMATDKKKSDCPNHSCPYNNNSADYGYWCCGNSIMFDAVRKLLYQRDNIRKLERKIDSVWTGKRR